MTRTRRQIVLQAARLAARVRRTAGVPADAPVCVYDLAERLGVEVRFLDVPSLEGMYARRPRPAVVVSSLRPPGRQAYTAAHELGHHAAGHGFHVDQLLAEGSAPSDPDEVLAEAFAGFLLMPRAAVERAFAARGWVPAAATPAEVFTAAGWLGVGYTALLTHLRATLQLLPASAERTLRRAAPKAIRAGLLGADCPGQLIVVDSAWADRAVDLAVGDVALAPPGVGTEGRCVEVSHETATGTVVRAVAPGRGRLVCPATGWAAFVRVSRAGYVGLARFRHLEETDDGHEAEVHPGEQPLCGLGAGG